MSTQFQEVDIEQYSPTTGPDIKNKVAQDSRVHWFFNPAARIDVRDRVTGNEVSEDGKIRTRSFVKAGVLVPFRNVIKNVSRPKDQPPPPGTKGELQTLLPVTKYAFEIADELAFAYADTGAGIVDSLTGIEDEALVRSIYRLCMGTRLRVETDPMLPGEKVPVIPAMLEYLYKQAPANIEEALKETRDTAFGMTVENTRLTLIAYCERAISGWAKQTVQESRKSIADRSGGHPGRSEFDARDRRMFAALGESIPTDIQPTSPTLEKAVELLMQRELKEPVVPVEDPRVAILEKTLAKMQRQLETLSKATNAGS